MAGRQQPRKIVINGTEYLWVAKGHGPTGYRRRGWSPKCLRLVVTAPSGTRVSMDLYSKNWEEGHEHNRDNMPEHLAALRPVHVRAYIEQALRSGWSPISRRSISLVPENIP